jgi:DNA primase catalytic core
MARIPAAELERLKRDISIEQLATTRGIVLKPSGTNLLGLCPFHEDHEPSLSIDPVQNLWHCFGCQQGGGVIDWVMKSEGVSFRHAVELLRQDVSGSTFQVQSSSPTTHARIVKHSRVPKLAVPLPVDAEAQHWARYVMEDYHTTLTDHAPEGKAYLAKRGLLNEELITTFTLGFANRTLGYRLPRMQTTDGAVMRGTLQQLGYLRPSGHEHFRGCLTVPILDEQGHVTEMYGRRITHGRMADQPLHLYLPGPHKGVWNLAAFTHTQELILCEAALDALTFWVHGYRNVTFSYGVDGFTPDHLTALQQHGMQRVLIAYDADAAGDRGAEKLAQHLTPLGIACFRVQFPAGLDANEYAQQTPPARESLGTLLAQAVPIGAVANIVSRQHPVASREEQTGEPEGTTAVPEKPTQEVTSSPAPSSSHSPAPSAQLHADVTAEQIILTLGDRRYRIRGLQKNTSYERLHVNLFVAKGEAFFIDTLDLYAAKARAGYLKQAAIELSLSVDVLKRDLGQVLLKLEELHDQHIRQTLEPKRKEVTLSDAERTAALELLTDPHLLDRILADFQRCGVVGEETNKLVGYLAAVSRLLDKPLAVLVQSSSAAGKTALMDAVLTFMPEDAVVKYSALTGQALFYLGEGDLRHKILALVEEEGAQRAVYALKLLQSEGELTIASTTKDPQSGDLKTKPYTVQGPVMLFLTSTAAELNDELQNRCLTLTVNEDRAQTRAIHRQQREQYTLDGVFAHETRQTIRSLHQNAQRLLQPLRVVNPYARQLTFLDAQTRTRRDHEKYQTLIASLALLHQHQRPVQTITRQGTTVQYVEVTREDIAIANRLAHEVFGRTLDDLAPQTRRLLLLLEDMVGTECERLAIHRPDYRFSRRQVRDYTGWGQTQVQLHLQRLVDLEYLLIHRGQRGQSFVYELLYQGEGETGTSFVLGLLDPLTLSAHGYDTHLSGVNGELSGSIRPQFGAKSGGIRDGEMPLAATNSASHSDTRPEAAEIAYREPLSSPLPYVPPAAAPPPTRRH